MLGIQINGEFLDLPPGTTMELETENPFLQLSNELIGEYSLPFQVIANEKNLRLLNYAAVAQNRIESSGVDALLYDKSIQIGAGKVKIEKARINLNRTAKGTISCYFLGTVSSFWQDIKDMKLRDIDAGGVRSFEWDDYDLDGSGFWGHIHEVIEGAVGAFDYAFFPVVNKGWTIDNVIPEVVNMVDFNSGFPHEVQFRQPLIGPANCEMNRICPFPYLKYVLQKAVDFTGWKISGDILDDADFEKIVMVNFRAINWAYPKLDGGDFSAVPNDPVEFDLADHLPDITISGFLLALKNRFGWYYDFDAVSKTITIHQLNELTTGQPVDMTGYASPIFDKSISQQAPVYSLKNNFVAGLGDGAPQLTMVDLQGDVDKKSDLPAAAEAIYGHVYRVVEENNYYICQQNDDESWSWHLYAYNIYDYVPDNANTDINTDATVLGNEYYSTYLDLIPRMDVQGDWFGRTDDTGEWGLHLLFYFGLRDNKSGDQYPFASHHIYDSNGYTLAAWSLAFKAVTTAAAEVGLHDLNWKDFIDMISGAEGVETKLSLPLHLYLQLKFSDRIVISGVQLFIKQKRSALPYKGEVNCVCIRV